MAFIGILIILCFRSYIAEAFLRHLMKNYYVDKSYEDFMDTIQLNVSFGEWINGKSIWMNQLLQFECCGPHSYKDWKSTIPPSCCGKSIRLCNASLTKLLGCTENLSMFVLLICLAFLFVSTGNIILHVSIKVTQTDCLFN